MGDGGDIQVAIVGGGVGGLALAGFLGRAGVEPVVIEPTQEHGARGDFVELWPEAMPLLDDLGVGAEVRAVGHEVTTWTRRRPDGTVATRLDAADGGGVTVVEDRQVREPLRDAAGDGVVYAETDLRALERTGRSVTVELTTGVREQFDAVVGADGVQSAVRQAVADDDPAPAFCGTTSAAFSADVEVAEPFEGVGEVWTSGGTVFRAAATGDRTACWLTVPTDVPDRVWDGPAAFESRRPGIDWLLPDALDAAGTEDVRWHDDFRVPVDRWADGRVALLGAAAHGRHRLSGLSPTLAIEDAAALASALVRGDGTVGARLADYAAGRRSRLNELECVPASDAPLVGIESDLCERCPDVQTLRGARLRSCFDGSLPAPTVEIDTDWG